MLKHNHSKPYTNQPTPYVQCMKDTKQDDALFVCTTATYHYLAATAPQPRSSAPVHTTCEGRWDAAAQHACVLHHGVEGVAAGV